MPRAVASNPFLLRRINEVLTELNGLSEVMLFTNGPTITSATLLSDFTECTFSGYARINTTGLWTGAFLIVNGEYQFNSPTLTFTPVSGGQLVQGWLILVGSEWVLGRKFDTPIFVSDADPLALILKPQVYSRHLFPCDRS